MEQLKVGRFITKKRKEQNLTQEQLAERLGISNKTCLLYTSPSPRDS